MVDRLGRMQKGWVKFISVNSETLKPVLSEKLPGNTYSYSIVEIRKRAHINAG